MNNLLDIKLSFAHEPKRGGGSPRNLNKTRITKSKTLEGLIDDLKRIKVFYQKENRYVKQILLDVYYNDLISKSGRIQELLRISGD